MAACDSWLPKEQTSRLRLGFTLSAESNVSPRGSQRLGLCDILCAFFKMAFRLRLRPPRSAGYSESPHDRALQRPGFQVKAGEAAKNKTVLVPQSSRRASGSDVRCGTHVHSSLAANSTDHTLPSVILSFPSCWEVETCADALAESGESLLCADFSMLTV